MRSILFTITIDDCFLIYNQPKFCFGVLKIQAKLSYPDWQSNISGSESALYNLKSGRGVKQFNLSMSPRLYRPIPTDHVHLQIHI